MCRSQISIDLIDTLTRASDEIERVAETISNLGLPPVDISAVQNSFRVLGEAAASLIDSHGFLADASQGADQLVSEIAESIGTIAGTIDGFFARQRVRAAQAAHVPSIP